MLEYKVMSRDEYNKLAEPQGNLELYYIDNYNKYDLVLVKMDDERIIEVIYEEDNECPEDKTLNRNLGILVNELNKLAIEISEV